MGVFIDSVDDPSPLDAKMRREARLDLEERIVHLRMCGVSYTAIAERFGVTRKDVTAILKRHQQRYIDQMASNRPHESIIAETLQFLDGIEKLCLREASIAGKDDGEIDPVLGKKTVGKVSASLLQAKRAFIESALNARKAQIDILTKTGVIPAVPTKIEFGKSDKELAADESVERSIDDIKANIGELMKRLRTL